MDRDSSTRLDSRQVDGGIGKGGLYNGGEPPEEKDRKRKRKNVE